MLLFIFKRNLIEYSMLNPSILGNSNCWVFLQKCAYFFQYTRLTSPFLIILEYLEIFPTFHKHYFRRFRVLSLKVDIEIKAAIISMSMRHELTVWPQPIWKKVRSWWQIPPQHQRRPRISIIWNPPFQTQIYLVDSKK